ncbi:MAG: hypothetical protein AUG51_26215 [Acidobacteria bacterium 13_1_20CM_3_53_8]|nr:MAG: hypothetical protein AUG51_26215 [Acidobacteria bacterium 13_1_20CM_3_53_8]
MNKDNVLFAIIGLLVGLIVGFMFANSVNQRSSAAPLAQMSQAAALPPNHPPITSNTGQEAGPDMAAVQAAVKVARDQPDNFEAQTKVAEFYYQVQRYDDALQFLKRANQLRPEDYETIVQLGNVNFDATHYEEAERWYTAALQKKADDVNVRTDLGLTFMFREPADLDRAISEFRRSLERDAAHVQTLQNLTVAYTRKGDAGAAQATLNKLQEVSPNNPAIASLRSDLENLRSAPARTAGTQ